MRTLQNDYDSLKRLHDAANTAIESLQKENEILKKEIVIRDAKLLNCQTALDINKDIMRNALTEQNAIKDTYSKEIQELKAKIKELSNGNNNRLGE